MAQKRKYAKKKHSSSSPLLLGLIVVMALLVVLSLGLRFILDSSGNVPPAQIQDMLPALPDETVPALPTEPKLSFWEQIFGAKETEPAPVPEPEHMVAQASIAVTGDILMHMPVINTGLQANGSYNFDPIFRYLAPYTTSADLALANLETTLCGTEGGYKYSGYPAFNCPDEIVDALKNAGFDLLLTANNHCYDTSEYGFLRTVRTVRSKGLDTLGTYTDINEPRYVIQEINGIKIGMLCYTYEGKPEKPAPGVVYMNRNAMSTTSAPLVNSFDYDQMDPFYMDIRNMLAEMKAAGADATVMFIHWGTEYQTVPSIVQQDIAQQLCDLGLDVIVGGHPHVIQPMALLTSRLEPEYKTVCLYSTGNAVSNQRIAEMDLKTGHTEDALLFTFTFSRYSDDTVYLEDAQILPCWVDMRTGENKEYDIIPLDAAYTDQWQTLYDLTAEAFDNAKKSYDRTVEITGAGLSQVRSFLSAQKEQREADYLAAAASIDAAA